MASKPRLLLTGSSGQLGGYLLRELASQDVAIIAWSGTHAETSFGVKLQPVELRDADAVKTAFELARPDLILHAAARTSVAECWKNPARAIQVNSRATARLAELAGSAGARMLLVSTDLVFDGTRGGYVEQDQPAPLSVYGRSKVAAEEAVLAYPRSVVARASLLFGPTVIGRPCFFDAQMNALREGRPIQLFADEWRSPLGHATAARALLRIIHSDFEGVIHVGGPERLSRLEMGQRLAAHLGVNAALVEAAQRASQAAPEPRPRDVSLNSALWRSLYPSEPWPVWDDSLREMLVPRKSL
jgi:dTDP-4-dehydrorhamnose reductase